MNKKLIFSYPLHLRVKLYDFELKTIRVYLVNLKYKIDSNCNVMYGFDLLFPHIRRDTKMLVKKKGIHKIAEKGERNTIRA